MKHLFVIRQLRHSIIDARVPQNPTLGVVDKVAVAGKADGRPDVDSRCPTRFVRATAVTAVDHIEAVYPGPDLRVGDGGNSHAGGGGRQRQDRNREGERNVSFHEILHSKPDRKWAMTSSRLQFKNSPRSPSEYCVLKGIFATFATDSRIVKT